MLASILTLTVSSLQSGRWLSRGSSLPLQPAPTRIWRQVGTTRIALSSSNNSTRSAAKAPPTTNFGEHWSRTRHQQHPPYAISGVQAPFHCVVSPPPTLSDGFSAEMTTGREAMALMAARLMGSASAPVSSPPQTIATSAPSAAARATIPRDLPEPQPTSRQPPPPTLSTPSGYITSQSNRDVAPPARPAAPVGDGPSLRGTPDQLKVRPT